MKAKQLVFVLVLLLVLGAAALWLSKRNEASWSSTATHTDAKVITFPLNDVAHVTIKGGGAEVNLVKKQEVWTVRERADYPADFQKVSQVIRKLWELKPVQDIKIGPSQLARLQLTEPTAEPTSGTLLELKDSGDKRLSALLLGKNQMRESEQVQMPGGFPVGRYVMAQDGSNHVSLVSETFADLQTKPEQWLNHDFIRIENAKLIAMKSTTPASEWTLTRENATAPWKLADAKPGEEFDVNKATAIASLFASPQFTDVLAPDAQVQNIATARLETVDGFVYELKIGALQGESYPVLVSVNANLPKERTPAADEKPEDKQRLDLEFVTKQKQLTEKLEKEQKFQGRPYLIAKSTVDELVKERSGLMAEKRPSTSPAPGATASAPPPKAASPTPAKPKKK